jgi:hypothetical protein
MAAKLASRSEVFVPTRRNPPGDTLAVVEWRPDDLVLGAK